MRKLYLDDVRTPSSDWIVVRNYQEFVSWINENGVPDVVSFDHDLATISYNPFTRKESFTYHDETGLDAAQYLIKFCIDNGLTVPRWKVHSQNELGKELIESYLLNHTNKDNEKN